jgi:hypothetical protein
MIVLCCHLLLAKTNHMPQIPWILASKYYVNAETMLLHVAKAFWMPLPQGVIAFTNM